ncbi:MAG: hypothetical protein HY804_02580 [Nitrospinae bacterium]|nr:hypothetical protein [Nitrospinota bacterium]
MTGKAFAAASTLLAYLFCAIWYAVDAWRAWGAVHSAADYPFYLSMDNWATTGFNFAGALYWVTFGLDRSGSPLSMLGYVMAGTHVAVFAFQVYLGPMMWAANNLLN